MKQKQAPDYFLLCDRKTRDCGDEACEWEEEARNELKQQVGRTLLQTTAIFQALAEKGARRRESEMITTSIREPQDGDLGFFGKTCVAALVFKNQITGSHM